MGRLRRGLLFTRRLRHRRVMWRAALVLLTLGLLSLLGMLWSFSLDSVETTESMGKSQHSMQPPPRHGDDFVEVEGNIQPPLPRRPSQRLNASPASPPTAHRASSATTLWFNDDEVSSGDGNRGLRAGVYQSDGVVRVVLTASRDQNTGEDTPQFPWMLAPNVSWRAYERHMQGHARTGDAPWEANTPDTVQGPTKMRIRPLRQVEVQLLRQRASRNVWATSSAHDMGAVVGIIPLESGLLATADELLVEQHLRAEDRHNASPDPSRFLTLAAAYTRDEEKERGGRTLHIDVPSGLLKTRAADDAMTTAPTPLITLKSAPRTGNPAEVPESNTDVSTTTTTLTWCAGGAETEVPATLDIALDVVHPRRVTSDGYNDGDNVGQNGSTANEVYTDALQATVCSARLVRLYGFSTLSLKQKQQGNTTMDAMDGVHSIPLNLAEGVKVMVGGRLPSSPHTSMPGVVPLLYMDLDTGDVPQQPSPSSTTRRTVGLLWLHPAPFILSTFTAASAQTCVRLRSTAGSTKLFLLPGPTPADVLRQYYTLTGFPTLPPCFMLGYHHGLRSAAASTEEAVEALDTTFLRSRVPLDSVWVTDTAVSARDTPFTWNRTRFPDPVRLQSNLWYGGRRYIVVRTVPTIPITTRSPLFLEGRRESFFVSMGAEKSAGWPAHSMDGVPSHVVDFINPSARRWYGNMLKYRRYVGSTNHTYASLQYAAPSVMADNVHNTALSECALRELSRVGDLLPMEVGHHGSFLHREVHQLLPVAFARSVHEGMLRRTQYVRRALVLTESYYAGIQRYAVVQMDVQLSCTDESETQVNRDDVQVIAAGTKKNVLAPAWAQLQRAVQQCAQLSTLGIPFSGANLGAGLTREVLRQLLQRQPSEAAEAAAMENAPENGGGDTDDKKPTPASRVVQPTPLHFHEAAVLLVRWYQVGVFFPLMYTEENTAAAEASAVTQSSTKNGTGNVAAPWWMRLPVDASTTAAIHANLKVRYALVPYLYTVAHDVSERGVPFFAPLSFARPNSVPTHPAAGSAFQTCYAVGDAVVVCPVTSSLRHDVVSPTQGKMGAGLFDLWTGVWDTPSVAQAPGDTVAVHVQGTGSLRWLAMTGRGTMPASAAGLPTSASFAPAFLRPGYIVATQNVLWPSADVTRGGAAEDDVYTVHSTHMGANWTVTVALPPLPLRTASTTDLQLLAEGDVFWDEGSRNNQQSPPLDFPTAPHRAQHCLLQLRCLYEAREDATANLIVEVHQTSNSCAEAVAELQSHWQEEPEGFAERLSQAKERRDTRLHARQVEQNEQEDRGLRLRHRPDLRAETLHEEDLNGLRLPRWTEEAARNELLHAYLLHRIRFLFQRKEDAAQLIGTRGVSDASTVVVERQAVSAERGSGTTVSGVAPVSRSMSSSHEVLVDISACNTSVSGASTTAVGDLAATPLFGVATLADGGGKAALHVPPTHAWRFVFPLQ